MSRNDEDERSVSRKQRIVRPRARPGFRPHFPCGPVVPWLVYTSLAATCHKSTSISRGATWPFHFLSPLSVLPLQPSFFVSFLLLLKRTDLCFVSLFSRQRVNSDPRTSHSSFCLSPLTRRTIQIARSLVSLLFIPLPMSALRVS